MKKTKSGFTIVELLIVIVVIAILAAISMVAYTNIQSRAAQSVNFTAIGQYVRTLQIIKTEVGLPVGAGPASACLGPEPLPESCDIGGQNAVGSSAQTATMKNLLLQYGMGTQPAAGIANKGHLVYTSSYYGEPALLWIVPDTQECLASPGRLYMSGGWTNNVRKGGSSGGSTYCTLSLSNL